MAAPAVSDIFKFMTLRSPQLVEHQKDVVNYIRDSRIRDSYLVAETHDIQKLDTLLRKSEFGAFVAEQIQNRISGLSSNRQVLESNRQIAEAAFSKFGLNERICDTVDALVEIIQNHCTRFDEARLRRELDAAIRRFHPEMNGLDDYLEKPVTQREAPGGTVSLSQWCVDFEDLFEQLYLLYVCKRKYPVNLGFTMDGLRALRVAQFVKMQDDRTKATANTQRLNGCLFSIFTLLVKLWNRNSTPAHSALVPQEAKQAAGAKNYSSAGTGGEVVAVSSTDGAQPSADEKARCRCAEMKLTDGGRFPVPVVTIQSAEDLQRLMQASPCVHKIFAYLLSHYKPFNDIRPVGIGDLLVVKQFLSKYEAGEISHVENVLLGESRDRSYRELNHNENTYSTSAERTEQTQKELQTTTRYELQAETASTMQSDLSTQFSAAVSGKYGMLEFSTNAGISYHQSKSDSQRSASNFSKNVVDRSLTNIQKTVREEQSSKKIFETEEIDRHGFNNTKGNGNVTGVYRWLNKHYLAQVYNYGKRLMFEFIIPEPSAFIKAVVERNKEKAKAPDAILPPEVPNITLGSITSFDVAKYAALYEIDISGLDSMPADTKSLCLGCDLPSANNTTKQFSTDIPEGYYINSASLSGRSMGNKDSLLSVTCCGNEVGVKVATDLCFAEFNDVPFTFPNAEKTMVVEAFSQNMNMYAFMVTATCHLSEQTRMAWQNKAYGLIMNGYSKKLAAYKGELADYQAKLDAYKAIQDGAAQGYNPLTNDGIIRTELKKHCLTMITKQFASDAFADENIDFDSMDTRSIGTGAPIPAIDIDKARERGTLIQFLEQAFEWNEITYLLYPYFWSRINDRWFDAQQYFNEVDSAYGKFLQAGSARVLVAVHPAYERAVLHYLYTQEPWNGGDAPTINDPMYIPIYAELKAQQDDLAGATPYGDPWEVVVPTSLVYLQSNSDLPVFDVPKLTKSSS